MIETALNHKISDAVRMHIDKDAKGWPVIEIEFRFVRYRLSIDNQEKGEKLKELLDLVLNPASRNETEKEELPNFYKKND